MWPRGSGIDTLVRKWRVCSVVCFSDVWIAAELALLSKGFLALCEAWPCCACQAPSCGELLAVPVACTLRSPGPTRPCPSESQLQTSVSALLLKALRQKGDGPLGSPGGKIETPI